MIGTEDARSGALWFVAPMVRSFYGRSRDEYSCIIAVQKETLTMGDNTLNLHTSERLGNVSLRIRDIHQSVEVILDSDPFQQIGSGKELLCYRTGHDTENPVVLGKPVTNSKVRCHVELNIVFTLL